VALWLYQPAFGGVFVSDDDIYLSDNPFVQDLSLSNLGAIWNPAGDVPSRIKNYAPVHLMLHALEWRVFGADVWGYHVVNALVHAVASFLLVVLLRRWGASLPGAAAAGVFFLVHPANVEAVAWISQLKTSSALALSLAALLALARRPALATTLFTLALLAKPTAAVALPVAAIFVWVDGSRAPPRAWAWLALWVLLLAVFGLAEFSALAHGGSPPVHPDLRVRLQSSLVIALRYLVMATTSWGVSVFHEPTPVSNSLDPRLLAAVGVLGLLGWRMLSVLRRRRAEAAFWIWALVSFAPVSQLVPFAYPMADRYLYFILPGLLGGALLAGQELWRRAGLEQIRAAQAIAGALLVAVLAVFAARSHERAAIWVSHLRVMADGARHYPDGTAATLMRVSSFATAGDAERTVHALRILRERRGWNAFDSLLKDPVYARVREDPAFQELVRDLAGDWIRFLDRPALTQRELMGLAEAHRVRGERGAEIRALERALEVGGPFQDQLRAILEAFRAETY